MKSVCVCVYACLFVYLVCAQLHMDMPFLYDACEQYCTVFPKVCLCSQSEFLNTCCGIVFIHISIKEVSETLQNIVKTIYVSFC